MNMQSLQIQVRRLIIPINPQLFFSLGITCIFLLTHSLGDEPLIDKDWFVYLPLKISRELANHGTEMLIKPHLVHQEDERTELEVHSMH